MKSAFTSIAKKAIMAKLAKEVPKLFLGKMGSVFNPIAGLIIDKILTVAVEETEAAAFFLYIDTRTGKQSKEFEDAAIVNYNAQRSGNKDEIAKAERNLKIAFLKFASLRN